MYTILDDHEKKCLFAFSFSKQQKTTSELGDIHFSMCYNNGQERLNIVIIEAKGLKLLEGFQNVGKYPTSTMTIFHTLQLDFLIGSVVNTQSVLKMYHELRVLRQNCTRYF